MRIFCVNVYVSIKSAKTTFNFVSNNSTFSRFCSWNLFVTRRDPLFERRLFPRKWRRQIVATKRWCHDTFASCPLVRCSIHFEVNSNGRLLRVVIEYLMLISCLCSSLALFPFSVPFGLDYLDAGDVRRVQLQQRLSLCFWHVCWPLVLWVSGIQLNSSKRKRSSAMNFINNGTVFCETTHESHTIGHMCWHGRALQPVWLLLFYSPVLQCVCAVSARKKNNWICSTWCQVCFLWTRVLRINLC